jgi:hypothetical protein
MDIRRGGKRYCPHCEKVVETRVLPEGYKQIDYRGVLAKRRKIVCGTDRDGTGGCGHMWFTIEVPDVAVG